MKSTTGIELLLWIIINQTATATGMKVFSWVAIVVLLVLRLLEGLK